MGIRKALAYTHFKARPYTRKSKKSGKNYIKAVPNQHVVKMKMGNIKDYESGKLNIIIRIHACTSCQVRDLALEASRQSIHKHLDFNIPGQYYLEVRVFPHHVLRENKVLTGAGADRLQTGMAHSFGVTVGRAAMVKKDQEMFIVAVSTEKARKVAMTEIAKVKAKLPCHVRTSLEIKPVKSA